MMPSPRARSRYVSRKNTKHQAKKPDISPAKLSVKIARKHRYQ